MIGTTYEKDYADHLNELTAEEESGREMRGGVFAGLLTRAEWETRDADLRREFGSGMDEKTYEDYLMRSRLNKANVQRRKAEAQRQTRRFFEAERCGIPHHGQSDERI